MKTYLIHDQKKRCPWCLKDEQYVHYHDEEWGEVCHDDSTLFEFLLLETFQAGLSWHTILKKRENFRSAFDQFDVNLIASYNDLKVHELMKNASIIRHKAKILAAIRNAQKFIQIQDEYGSFDRYIWQFTNYSTIVIPIDSWEEVKKTIPESDAMAKDLKSRGFMFIGSTTCMAFMESIGMVSDHFSYCWKNKKIK